MKVISRHMTGWQHPNHLAGFLAEVAQQVVDSRQWQKAARATQYAARRVWAPYGRRGFAARWQRLVHEPIDYRSPVGVLPSIPALIRTAARILYGHDVTRARDRCKPQFWAVLVAETKLTKDDIDKIELKWRIRDWLSLTEENNVPPNVRLAAAAAWEVGERKAACEIVMGAAIAATEKRRRREELVHGPVA